MAEPSDTIKICQSDLACATMKFDELFEKAQNYTRNCKYKEALMITQALKTFNLPDSYRSRVHLLRAEIFTVLKQYKEAAGDARLSIHFELNFASAKIYHESISLLHGPNHSLREWWEFYKNIHEEEPRIFSLKEIIYMLVRGKGLDGMVLKKLTPKPPKNHLEKVIVELFSANLWLGMAYLIIGTVDDGSVFCGSAGDCSTKKISVVPLLNDYSENCESWVDRLAAAIIKGGSPIENLIQFCNQPPLHTAAKFALDSGFFELYRLVARMYKHWRRSGTKNEQGLSLFEYLRAKGYESTPNFQKLLSIDASLTVETSDITAIQEDFLTRKAKTAVDNKQYDKALQHYHEILDSLDPTNNAERARHFRNVSLVHSCKNEFEKSLEFADKCLAADPSLEKAYYRKTQVLKDLKRPHLACLVYLEGLPYAENPALFLSEAVKLLETNGNQFGKNYFKECLSLFQKVESSLWNQVLCSAAVRSQWTTINLIVVGPSNRPLAKEFDASGVSLSTLYEITKTDDNLRKSCHLMLLELLKHGADIFTLSNDPAEVFPILVELSLLIESCTVLEYVLKRNPLRETDLLLHTAVKSGNVKTDHCFKVVLILLQKGIDPNVKDSEGKTALAYVTSKFAITRALLRIYTKDLGIKSESLEKKGNGFFKDKNYDLACCYYTVAIAMLGQNNKNSDLGFRLRYRRCECYMELEQHSLAVEDALFISNSKSYKSQELLGKAYLHNSLNQSFYHFYKAYELLDCKIDAHVRQKIVVKILYLTQELELTSIPQMWIDDVLLACMSLMETCKFTVAAYTFRIILEESLLPKDMDASRIDVRHFCSDAAICYGHMGVFEEVIISLLDRGANLQNLTVYEGDTYLHAAVILACRLGYISLLDYVISDRAIRLCECNVVDKYGKTPFGRILCEPESVHKPEVIQIFRHVFDKVLKHHKMPEKTLPKDVFLRIDDGSQQKPPNKKGPDSTASKKPSDNAPSLAKSEVKYYSQQFDDACSYCEKLYNCALKKQTSDADADKVISSLIELCQMNHEGKVHEEWLRKSIDVIIDVIDNQPDIPACVFSIKTNVFLQIVLRLASTNKWECLHTCVKSYEQKKKGNVLKGFANGLTVADFLYSIVFKRKVQIYSEILECLIKNGATIGMNPHLKKTALDVCLMKGNYRAIIVLLKNGLDSSLLSLKPGDTPLHAAAEIALRKDTGYFELFEYLLKLYDSDSATYSHLDISRIDKQEQSMTHVACRIKCSKHSLRLLRICHERGVRSDLPDSSGKIPSEYISNNPNDERLRYLTRVSSESPSTSKSKCDVALPEKSVARMNSVKSEKKYSLRSVLKDLIDNMDDHKCKQLHVISFHKEDKKPVSKYRAEDAEDAEHVQESSDEPEDEDADDENDLLNDTMFDKLEWEVECTSDVWKTLHDENMPYKKRKQAIYKIQLLAGGDWHHTLSKKVKKMPQTLKLFTLKLSRTSWIVWELAVTFSPRCSDAAKSKDYTGVKWESAEGRVYTEVIRIWAIVFNMTDLKNVFEQIVKSHQRAESCHVKKQLETIYEFPSGDATKKRLPRFFAETKVEKHSHNLQRYSPPVSDKDDEYHIIKFYSFSAALVSSVLQMENNQNVDFPFRVTELEHRIINLNSTAPIILLGRSGTGKTTCCVYRLWMAFVKYWTMATLADAAHNPLLPVKARKPEDEDEEETNESTNDNKICVDDAIANSSDCTESREYVHLHQLFITKNGVLCNEVRKNFHELRHGNEITGKYPLQENFDLPPTFQDVSDNHFPLFLTSKKLWVILDASLQPPYFFPRQGDLSLKQDIIGWSNEDDHLVFLPNIDDDDDDDEEERFTLPYESFGSQMKVKNKKQEVTYEKFLQLWPEVNKPASGYDASLVWTEIISFIKGSFEALHTEKGYLSEDEYISIGKKRAPNFNGEREKIYQLFLRYLARKKQKQMFDESDVVFNLYKRLQKEDRPPCPLHEIYVDETQDFTQAELCLLIQLSEDPNRMFLTGDTAQSIMRGVSFRFSDLQSLFYYAKNNAVNTKEAQAINRPKSIYKLLHNYRSHQGILKMASSIIDILLRYFQDSFDPMEKDQGLFDGPKPKLLESCSLTDLSMMLRRDKREMSHIEFGAHQVILVVDNESREKLPEELSTALVLTIFEAKGLEFDDVLLYNFFKDSKASKEWRIVTKFLDELVNNKKADDESTNQENMNIQINWDVFQQANRPRPLDFNPEQHKILNSELKLLYTALTRARVNLWIFDTDVNKRAPMFDYLKSLDLVDTINTDLKAEDINTLIFAEESTREMWLQRGDDFMRKSLYKIAAKCYNLGDHKQQENLALANHHALTAQRCSDVQTKRENFLQAGQFYMECNQHIKAAKCLGFAKEKLLSTEIFEKCCEYEFAGKAYLLLQKPAKATECFEKLQQFDRAVEISHDSKMFARAIDLVNQYNALVESYVQNGEAVPEVLIKHKPQKNLTYLYLQLANACYSKGEIDKMKNVLNKLKSDEKMEFLEKKGLISLAAEMLFEEGQLEKAIQLLRRSGCYKKSIELARRSGGDLLLANCLYTFAQHKYVTLKNADENLDTTALKEQITLLLDEAKTCYQRTADRNGHSLCLLLLSYVNNDTNSAAEALTSFLRISPHPNIAGALQSANILIEHVQQNKIDDMGDIVKAIEMGYKLLNDLRYTAPTVSLPLRECLEHFGFHILNNLTVCVYPQLQPLVSIQLEPMMSITDSSSQHPIKEIKQKLHQHLLKVIENLFVNVRMTYMIRLIQSIQCPVYIAGHECQNVEECFCALRKVKVTCKQEDYICMHSHKPYSYDAFNNTIKLTQIIMLMDHELIDQVNKEDLALMKQVELMMGGNVYMLGKLLVKLLIPTAGNALPLTHSQFQSLKKRFSLFPKCSKYIRNYLFAMWKRIRSRGRAVSDFFLESKMLIDLFGLNTSVERWMKELCQSTNCVDLNQSPGILIPCDGFNVCVYERFIESLIQLYERSDPFESLIKFTQYTGLLMRKAIVLPNLDILLFWCEIFVVIALTLVLKNQKQIISSLPESYLIQSQFVDCLQQKSTFSFQTAIAKSKPLDAQKMTTLFNRIEKLVHLLCNQKILQVALKDRYVKSGVTERYLVIGLLLLSNINRGIPERLLPEIRHALNSFSISNVMAPRLKESLSKLHKIKGSLDTVLILNELLQKRGDSLGQYYWNFNIQTGQGLQCCFLANATSSLNSLNFKETTEKQTQDEEYYPEEDEDGFTEPELSQVKEDAKKFKAVDIISRAYRTYKCRTLLKQLVFNVSNEIAKESGNQVDYFTDIKLNETGCNICGLLFISPPPLQPEIIVEDAPKEGGHSSQIEEYNTRESEMEKHRTLHSHKENESSFQCGVLKYRQEFVPIWKRAQKILLNEEQINNLNPEIEFYFEQLNKTIKKLEDEMRKMCKKACWKDFPILHSILNEVETDLDNLDKKLTNQQTESANKDQNEAAILEDDGLDDFDDAQDIVQEPKAIRTQVFRRKRKGGY